MYISIFFKFEFRVIVNTRTYIFFLIRRRERMANDIKLLELLKWHSDEEHPITQKKLREKAGIHADEWLGHKGTFRKHLIEIADTLNKDAISEKDLRIVMGGKANENSTRGKNQRNFIGKLYYQHEIDKYELKFLVNQINGSNLYTPEQKGNFSGRLIKALGTEHFDMAKQVEIENITSGSDIDNTRIAENLDFLKRAMENKKMIEFRTMRLDIDGTYVNNSGWIMLSPYKIVFHKGYYWLLGNCRFGEYNYRGWNYVSYGDSIDVFRIDKLTHLRIAKECIEKKARYAIRTERWLAELASANIYQEHEKIKSKDISSEYGRVEFEVLWERYFESEKYDYSFIRDTFGKYYTLKKEDERIIISVQASVNCFIQWVMPYIDRVKIMDTYSGKEVKKKIRKMLEEGMKCI